VIRVLLADDQALIRAGFRVLLDSAQGIEVIGEAEDGAQAVELAHRHRADVVLMDIRMPASTASRPLGGSTPTSASPA
jgi:YesN/AraC family two-component response regulator